MPHHHHSHPGVADFFHQAAAMFGHHHPQVHPQHPGVFGPPSGGFPLPPGAGSLAGHLDLYPFLAPQFLSGRSPVNLAAAAAAAANFSGGGNPQGGGGGQNFPFPGQHSPPVDIRRLFGGAPQGQPGGGGNMTRISGCDLSPKEEIPVREMSSRSGSVTPEVTPEDKNAKEVLREELSDDGMSTEELILLKEKDEKGKSPGFSIERLIGSGGNNKQKQQQQSPTLKEGGRKGLVEKGRYGREGVVGVGFNPNSAFIPPGMFHPQGHQGQQILHQHHQLLQQHQQQQKSRFYL